MVDAAKMPPVYPLCKCIAETPALPPAAQWFVNHSRRFRHHPTKLRHYSTRFRHYSTRFRHYSTRFRHYSTRFRHHSTRFRHHSTKLHHYSTRFRHLPAKVAKIHLPLFACKTSNRRTLPIQLVESDNPWFYFRFTQ
jgi:hypothetical protein